MIMIWRVREQPFLHFLSLRGAKHQKVVKLHTKLGKPIPCLDPVVVTKGESVFSGKQELQSQLHPPPHQMFPQPPASGASSGGGVQVYQQVAGTGTAGGGATQPPLINFVAPSKVSSGSSRQDESSSSSTVASLLGKPPPPPPPTSSAAKAQPQQPVEVNIPRFPDEKDVVPVGHDYIEEMRNADGKVTSFNCKLCECKFNDPNGTLHTYIVSVQKNVLIMVAT
jgi:zinc finger RNA-binding protein